MQILNSKTIKKQFEKSLDKYDENAVIQKDLAKKLMNETAKIRTDFPIILELGAGTGILTKQIKSHLIFQKFYANDLLEKSKNYVQKIIPDANFIHGSASRIKPPVKADLIISNAMFQWFYNLSDAINYCKKFLNNDGILAFSTFGRENFRELKEISGLTLNYLSKDEIMRILEPEFEILHTDEYTQIMDFESPLELLSHMKNTGVNSLASNIWTIKDVKNFCEKYLEKYDTPHLTYNPVIIIAKLKSDLK